VRCASAWSRLPILAENLPKPSQLGRERIDVGGSRRVNVRGIAELLDLTQVAESLRLRVSHASQTGELDPAAGDSAPIASKVKLGLRTCPSLSPKLPPA